jgi:hypothetical protein
MRKIEMKTTYAVPGQLLYPNAIKVEEESLKLQLYNNDSLYSKAKVLPA